MSEKTNEIAQLKDILPDLNSKLEDIECSIKNEKFNKVQEHLDEKVKFYFSTSNSCVLFLSILGKVRNC